MSARLRITAALLALLAAAPAGAQQPASGPVVAFVDVHVVPMTSDDVLEGQTVVIRNGRIERLGPVDSVEVPENAEVIEGLGGYLIPGLIDLHMHLTDRHEFPLWLSYGVTRVQSLNAFAGQFAVVEAVESGEVAGPTVHLCAGPISGIDTAEDARIEIARLAARGFECVKPYGDLSASAYAAIVEETRARGMRTVSHIPRNLTWQQVLATGPTSIAHAEEFLYSPIESQADLARIDSLMVANQIALVPTLANYATITEQPLFADRLLRNADAAAYSPIDRRYWGAARNHYVRSFAPDRLPRMRVLLGFQRRLVRRLQEAGVRVALGTDAGNTMVFPGGSVHDELDQLVRAGFEPAEALATATVNAARVLGLEGQAGVVAAGAVADLVLVLGNPLVDVTNARLVAGTMVRGRWLPRDTLDRNLIETERRFETEERLIEVLEAEGVAEALAWLADEAAGASRPPVRLRTLNELGYQLWRIEDDLEAAIEVFELNTRLFPDSEVARASLTEAREADGRDQPPGNAERSSPGMIRSAFP